MAFTQELIVWMVIWIIGCVVFDFWLELTGSLLMLGGAITYEVCNIVRNKMHSITKGD